MGIVERRLVPGKRWWQPSRIVEVPLVESEKERGQTMRCWVDKDRDCPIDLDALEASNRGRGTPPEPCRAWDEEQKNCGILSDLKRLRPRTLREIEEEAIEKHYEGMTVEVFLPMWLVEGDWKNRFVVVGTHADWDAFWDAFRKSVKGRER